MRQTAIQFYSQGLAIEGVLSTPPAALKHPGGAFKSGIVLVGHPHPMLGGDMDNAVVSAICRAIDRRDLASLRFNFRGVKGSEGTFSNGPGEHDDLVSAMDAMAHWPGVDPKRMAVAGYSFGAGTVLGALDRLEAARALALIAPPISAVRSLPGRVGKPMLLVAGTEDRVSPSVSIQRGLDNVMGPVKFKEIPGADHSLAGREEAVARAVAEFLAETIAQ